MTTPARRPLSVGLSILDALSDPNLFAPWFQPAAHWRAWRVFLAALFGLPLTEDDLALYQQHTGRSTPPSRPAREAWLVVGRRGGKSRIAALVAVFLAAFKDYRPYLAPGERATVMLIAADRKHARGCLRYIQGLLDGVPMLAALVAHRTAEAIHLTTRVTIEVHTASYRTTRGYTLAGCIADEIAFWMTGDEVNHPDHEVIGALRPAMATIPGALLLAISSPYARRGALYEAWRDHYGHDGDPVLVWQAPTAAMNPAIDTAFLAAEYEKDPASAQAEYGACFRTDVETFVPREVVEACVIPGRVALPPASGVRYAAFCDPSGGSQDSMTLAIAHLHTADQAILDVVREVRAPLNPEDVVREFAAILREYGLTDVTGDAYAKEWPVARFRAHGITYTIADHVASDLYRECLPLLMGRRVELLDDGRLLSQLCALKRTTSRAGRDLIAYPPRQHDDLVNAAAGALGLATRLQRSRTRLATAPTPPPAWTWAQIQRAGLW